MKRKTVLSFVLFSLFLASVGYCQVPAPDLSKDAVRIVNKNTYYEVVLDFRKQPSHRKMGEAYATQILRMVPNLEFIIDSYLKETTDDLGEYNISSEDVRKRVADIKPQIPPEYREELEGMASRFSGAKQNRLGDGRLSLDELYMINLIADVLRPTQCSAVGVYGKRSVTGKTISGRILDTGTGSQNQLGQLHAVITYKNGMKSICTIGYLGFMGALTGVNSHNVFAGLQFVSTMQSYTSKGKSSFPFDIRYALENFKSLDAAGNYLKSPERSYAFGHLIFFCDANTSKVLENNIGSGENCLREFRTEKSALNGGVEWGIDNAIGCVNSFVLKGNLDNHTPLLGNTARWESIKRELLSKGNTVNVEQVKAIASFHHGNLPGEQSNGDLYCNITQQIIIFEPDKPLQVFFCPKSGILPATPVFERIPVNLDR